VVLANNFGQAMKPRELMEPIRHVMLHYDLPSIVCDSSPPVRFPLFSLKLSVSFSSPLLTPEASVNLSFS